MTDQLLDHLLRSAPGEAQVDPGEVLVAMVGRPDWHRRAACTGMGADRFITAHGVSTAPARYICATCSVVAPCRAAAIAGDELGIWGGTSTQERRRVTAA